MKKSNDKKKDENKKSKKTTKKKANATEPEQQVNLSPEFINKLNEFILLSIEIFSSKDPNKQQEYYKFVNDNIHVMNPLFFNVGEEFMNIVFEKTEASEEVKSIFLEKWVTLKELSSKIYEFVKLQINLMARKNPEEDQQEWKQFTAQNLQIMNDDFFNLSKKVFISLLEQAIEDKKLRNEFVTTWESTVQSIADIRNTQEPN